MIINRNHFLLHFARASFERHQILYHKPAHLWSYGLCFFYISFIKKRSCDDGVRKSSHFFQNSFLVKIFSKFSLKRESFVKLNKKSISFDTFNGLESLCDENLLFFFLASVECAKINLYSSIKESFLSCHSFNCQFLFSNKFLLNCYNINI